MKQKRAAANSQRSHRLYKVREFLVPYLFILPFLISFLIFFFIPAIYSFYISMCRYGGFGEMNFIGLDNFCSLFQYGFFWQSISNVLFYFIMHTVPVMVISFLLSVLIASRFVRLKQLYKVFIFLPVTMASVSSTMVWKAILSTRTGALNNILGTQIPFLDESDLFRWSVVVILIWKSTGWFMTVFLAGLTTINQDLYEAATVDGADAFRKLISITIPLMRPIFLFAFLIETASSLKLYTEPRLLGAVQTVNPATNTVVGILVDYMNAGMYGMASAVGWVLFLMIGILSVIQFRIMSGKEETQ